MHEGAECDTLKKNVKEYKSRVKRDVVKHPTGIFDPCVTLSSPRLLECDT